MTPTLFTVDNPDYRPNAEYCALIVQTLEAGVQAFGFKPSKFVLDQLTAELQEHLCEKLDIVPESARASIERDRLADREIARKALH